VALITSALGISSAGAKQKVALDGTSKDTFTQNFLAQHEIGRRFRIDPAELPAPKTSAIVINRALTVPYNGQTLQVPPGFTATAFATGLVNPRRLLVLPNGDVLVAEQSAGYLTLLRDDGTGKAIWINRHVEDLNKPYGLAWQKAAFWWPTKMASGACHMSLERFAPAGRKTIGLMKCPLLSARRLQAPLAPR
jgi:hypothetical protein